MYNEDQSAYLKLTQLYGLIVDQEVVECTAPEDHKDHDRSKDLQYLVNLTVDGKCYSCNLVLTDKDVPTQSKLSYLLVKRDPLKKDVYCPTCSSLLFVNLKEVSEIFEPKRYHIDPKNYLELLRKKVIVDKILNPQVVALPYHDEVFSVDKSFVKVQQRPRTGLDFFKLNQKNWSNDLEVILDLAKTSNLSQEDLWKKISTEQPTPVLTESTVVTFEGIDPALKTYSSYVFLDIDGTSSCKAFSKQNFPSSRISYFMLKVLRILEERKILKTIFCTGRPLNAVLFMMMDSGLIPLCAANNGNQVGYPKRSFNQRTRDFYVQRSPHKKVIQEILQYIRVKYSIPLVQMYPSSPQVMLNHYYSPCSFTLLKMINEDSHTAAILKELNLKLDITPAENGILHVNTTEHTKGAVCQKLIDVLDIPKDRFFNVGNHLNDIPLSKILGSSYGVSNSHVDYAKVCCYQSPYEEAKGALDCIKHHLISLKLLKGEEFEEILNIVRKVNITQNEFYG